MEGYICSEKAARAIATAWKMVEEQQQQAVEATEAAAAYVQDRGQRLREFATAMRTTLPEIRADKKPVTGIEAAGALERVAEFIERIAADMESTGLVMMEPRAAA